MDIFEFLDGKQSLFLKSINYTMNDDFESKEALNVSIADSLSAKLLKEEKMIELIMTRCVEFKPEKPYDFQISMGACFSIKEEKIEELEQAEFDFKQEFIKQSKLLSGLAARISLLISQVTSSFGGKPLITPPSYIEKKSEED